MNTALKIAFPAADAENAVAATLAAASSSRFVLNAFVAAGFQENSARRPIQKQAAHRKAEAARRPDDGLLTVGDVAVRLQVSMKQVRNFVDDGGLRYINVGRGSKHRTMRFTPADVESCITQLAKRNSRPCPSTAIQSRRTTNTHSKSEVIGFTARRNAHRTGKPNK